MSGARKERGGIALPANGLVREDGSQGPEIAAQPRELRYVSSCVSLNGTDRFRITVRLPVDDV